MVDPFVIRAALAAMGVAVAAAPLGCFVVWRRMAYFGDATAHASILGVALALAFSLPVFLGTLSVALIMALVVGQMTGRGLATDTVLGVMAHSALAFGLVAAAFLPGLRLDLMSYLFGDVLAVTARDVALIWVGALAVLVLLGWRWQALLTATLSPDLAQAAGINARREQLGLTLALALTVALAIKVVGVLLIAALLIIPAAAARTLSRTPEQMAALALIVAVTSALGGIWVSLLYDSPAGPSIVCCAAGLFALFAGLRHVQNIS